MGDDERQIEFKLSRREARELMRYFAERTDQAVAEYFAKQIIMAEMDEAKKRGNLRGGDRRCSARRGRRT